MGKRIKDNLNSRYIEAANSMKAKKSRRRIVAYVESYDDIFFWRMLLSSFETKDRYFEVMLPTRSNKLDRGKKAAMMRLLGDKVGRDMIACVDADYDYLMQGTTEQSATMLENPYIFHTYAYAIENLQCYAPTLHDVCVGITLNDHSLLDIADWLRQYSEAIYQLFVWEIWFYRSSHYEELTITDFNRIIDTGHFTLERPYDGLAKVRNRAARKATQLEKAHPEAKESWQEVKRSLTQLGVTPQNTYLFIQGHHLLNSVVMPLMNKICDKLIRQRQNEIYRQAKHNTQLRNELASYQHSQVDVLPMIRKNVGWVISEQASRIRADLQAFLDGEQTTE